jgi:hypothetical protein
MRMQFNNSTQTVSSQSIHHMCSLNHDFNVDLPGLVRSGAVSRLALASIRGNDTVLPSGCKAMSKWSHPPHSPSKILSAVRPLSASAVGPGPPRAVSGLLCPWHGGNASRRCTMSRRSAARRVSARRGGSAPRGIGACAHCCSTCGASSRRKVPLTALSHGRKTHRKIEPKISSVQIQIQFQNAKDEVNGRRARSGKDRDQALTNCRTATHA